jgi:ABC-type transport system involved in multi-copper enzyme maturation permease subunit
MSYFYFIWKSHRSFLLFSMIIISLLQFLILRLVTAIDYSSIIIDLLDQLPEFVRTMFGEDFISMLSVGGAAAFGLNHPLVLVILSIGAITIPSRHIAGEAETGTLELVLSFPVSRIKLLSNLYISAVVFLFLIIFCALCSSVFEFSFGHKQNYLARCGRNHSRYQVLPSIWSWRGGVGSLHYPEIFPEHQQFFDWTFLPTHSSR